jgi:hypothetical protein
MLHSFFQGENSKEDSAAADADLRLLNPNAGVGGDTDKDLP